MGAEPGLGTFAFVLDAGFTLQAFSSAVEVLRLLRRLCGADACAYRVLSLDGAPVTASNGVRLLPDGGARDMPARAVVVVVAGVEASATPATELAAQIRAWARRGHPVWGVSSGVVRLAQAGLLGGRRIAAHWEDVAWLRETHPATEVSAALFVADGDVMTCAGGLAATEMMLWVVRRDMGEGIAEEIAARLVLDAVRDGRTSQRRMLDMRFQTANPVVFAALRMMRANLFSALTIERIARQQAISQRQLERLFAREFGQSPARVYDRLRLEDARQDVLNARRDLTAIALDYGFAPASFARTYRRVFGLLPSEDRRRAREGLG